jgi:hypothetical protein
LSLAPWRKANVALGSGFFFRERRVETEMSAEAEELPLFLPTPAFMVSAEEE